MVFLCGIFRKENSSLDYGPEFRSACEAFAAEMREARYLQAAYNEGVTGYLVRRQFGELIFDEELNYGPDLLALWILEARDLNHAVSHFDKHPELLARGVNFRVLDIPNKERVDEISSYDIR